MLILQHTIFSDSKITADFQKSSKRFQATPQQSMQDLKQENKPDSTTAEVVMFHGGCIV
jgi:hypothetical protein